jgi:hypothetical protein
MDARSIEYESNLVLSDLFCPDHVPVIRPEPRIQPLECLQRIDDVVERYGPAIVPFCARAQPEAHPGEIGRITHRLGNEPVFAGNLVQRSCHERVVDGLDPLS